MTSFIEHVECLKPSQSKNNVAGKNNAGKMSKTFHVHWENLLFMLQYSRELKSGFHSIS